MLVPPNKYRPTAEFTDGLSYVSDGLVIALFQDVQDLVGISNAECQALLKLLA